MKTWGNPNLEREVKFLAGNTTLKTKTKRFDSTLKLTK